MNNGLFRKNSLDKISSPEQVNDYIKTAGLSTWVIFFAAALLLMGAAVWGIFGTVDITIGSVAVCENGIINCYISETDIGEISDKAYVCINNQSYALENVSELPIPAKETVSPYGMHIGGFDEEAWVYTLSFGGDLPDGVYKAEIIIDSVSPISLLLN